jgi:hypothetical protein
VVNGVTQEDQTMLVTYTLFPAEDGGTNFVRETAIEHPKALEGYGTRRPLKHKGRKL